MARRHEENFFGNIATKALRHEEKVLAIREKYYQKTLPTCQFN
jgi:hypothetical protein